MNVLLGMFRNVAVIAIVILAIASIGGCSRSDEAITLVKNKEQSSSILGKKTIEEWYSSLHPKEEKYEWKAERKSGNVYLVSYVKTPGGGWFWEANLDTGSVVNLNDNAILSKKYGISQMTYDDQFILEGVTREEVTVNEPGIEPGIRYTIVAEVKNNSGHRITSAEVSAEFAVAYSEEKYVLLEAKGQDLRISPENPWKHGEIRKVQLQTPPYDAVLRNYDPTQAIVYLKMYATDPVGYEYRGAFSERNILPLFSKIKEG